MVRQLVERRFPLDLKPSLGPIESLYNEAKSTHWDPERDFDWAGFDTDSLDDAACAAAALVWSHRVWTGYGHLAATPALLVRFCLEHRREADPKYFLSMRGSEDAWYVDAAARMAESLGGFVETPPDTLSQALFDAADHVAALDADVPLEAYVAADVGLRLQIESDQLAAARDTATVPLPKDVLSTLERTKRRQCEFGWRYLEARAGEIDALGTEAIGERIRSHLSLERAGLNAPALAANAPSLTAAYQLAAQAGLGGIDAAVSTEAFEASIAAASKRLGALALPRIDLV